MGEGGEKEGRGEPHAAVGEWEGECKRQMDTNKEEEDTDSRGAGSGQGRQWNKALCMICLLTPLI